MNLIVCQHEWVSHCQARYRTEFPKGYWFEDAHYPLPRKEGKETVRLWYPDHIVQGILQTLELNRACLHTSKYVKEVEILREIYPEYLDLYWQAYRVCKKSSNKALQEKRKDPAYDASYRELMSKGLLKLYAENDEFSQKNAEMLRKLQPKATAAALTPESKKKRKASFKSIRHQQGESNSQYGTMWITDGMNSKKILKGAPIPEGFRPGRKIKR